MTETMLYQEKLIHLIPSLWRHLRLRRQFQFSILLFLMLVSSLFEMFSLGSVLPFIGVLINPNEVFSNAYLQPLITVLGISQPQELLFPITAIFCVAAVLAGLFRLVLVYANNHFVFSVGADFSAEIYRRTLYQSYSVHISRNSSEIINGITGKVAMLIGSVLIPMLTLIGSLFLLSGFLIILLFVNPIVALTTGGIFGLMYLFITLIFRRRLRENSERIAIESSRVIQAIQEGLGGIRDVLIDGTQMVYCEIYRSADQQLRHAQAYNFFISTSPRYIMETLGIVTIALIAFYIVQIEGSISSALPALGALALGAQRLLPVLQQGYNAAATIFGAEAYLRDGLKLLSQPILNEIDNPRIQRLPFEKSIRLEKVGFRYSLDGDWILRNISLEIIKGKRVGFVGATGAGKSTLVDLLMSLLAPSEGVILIDGESLGMHNYRGWQSHIAHVPQSVYLSDASVEENIAFGVPKKSIDQLRVREVAKQAQLDGAIENWPEKYKTRVGERGIRLSGGQRQRIGIARALYKRASVIIFDEATSALDTNTEKAVMQAIETLSSNLTLIIVAHRISTLKKCDFIVKIDNGSISRIGSYQEFIDQEMAV